MVSAEPAPVHHMTSTVEGWRNVTEDPSTGVGRDWW